RNIQNILQVKVTRGDALGAWFILKDLFEQKDYLRLTNLRNEFNAVRLTDCNLNVDFYLARIHLLEQQIKDASRDANSITEDAVISAILSGLPSTYKPWVLNKSCQKGLNLHTLESELRAMIS